MTQLEGGLLNEVEILDRLTRDADDLGKLTITPLVSLKDQLGPSSIDVRLGSEFRLTQYQRYPYLELVQPKDARTLDARRYSRLITIRPHPAIDRFILHPGEFALGSTLEYICVPNDLAARVEGRSSFGRLGLQIHSTAGFVEPGFSGCVTFELSNVGRLPIPLYVGMRVAQLSFQRISPSLLPYSRKKGAKYTDQIGTVASRLYEDPELDVLWALISRRHQDRSKD